MDLNEYFNRIDLTEIHDFVTNQVAEDIFLEFKTANYPQGIDFDKKNFSKCLSGFANSSGGILIWGISAKESKNNPDVANELKPIKDIIEFENYLKKNEGNAVIPLIEGIEYRRILENGQGGYLLVYIPSSERSPHMGLFADKRYFKRSGDSFYICEHFDIIDMLNRKTTPEITIELKNEKTIEEITNSKITYRYQSIFCVKNIGQVSIKNLVVYIKVNSPFHISNYGIDGNRNRGMKTMPTNEQFKKYISGNELVIHPETYHEVDKIVINETGEDKAIRDLIIDYKVVADDMRLQTGKIVRTEKELIENTSA